MEQTFNIPAITIDTPAALIESKLSLIRRYLVEIVMVILCTCIIYLFRNQNTHEDLLIDYYRTDRIHDQESIQKLQGIIENNTVVLLTIKTLIQELQHQQNKNDYLSNKGN